MNVEIVIHQILYNALNVIILKNLKILAKTIQKVHVEEQYAKSAQIYVIEKED